MIITMITTMPPTAVRRPPVPAQWWLGAGAALLALLQLLTLNERNPLTRTLSSYEYTDWGWLFPAALVVFGVGAAMVSARLSPAAPIARVLLGGAAVASWVTAAFPAGEGSTSGYWPGEVHRWGSIALVVMTLAAALAVRLPPGDRQTRSALVRLVVVGAVAGAAFLAGQTLKPAVPVVVGDAPLAGGLSQRVLVAAVAAVLLLIARASVHRTDRPSSSVRPIGPPDVTGRPSPQVSGAQALHGEPVRETRSVAVGAPGGTRTLSGRVDEVLAQGFGY